MKLKLLWLCLVIVHSANVNWGVTEGSHVALSTLLADMSGTLPAPDADETCVTFVVPTTGRGTLGRALASIMGQTSTCWRALVVTSVHGHIKPELNSSVPASLARTRMPLSLKNAHRVSYLTISHQTRCNWGGGARNAAFLFAGRARWIAFLDDDDVLAPHYVETLLAEEKLNPDCSAFIFRMSTGAGPLRVLPHVDAVDFKWAQVGISFAVRHSILTRRDGGDGIEFDPGCGEDYEMLDQIRTLMLKVVIVPYIGYYVQNSVQPNLANMTRAVIQRTPEDRVTLVHGKLFNHTELCYWTKC